MESLGTPGTIFSTQVAGPMATGHQQYVKTVPLRNLQAADLLLGQVLRSGTDTGGLEVQTTMFQVP